MTTSASSFVNKAADAIAHAVAQPVQQSADSHTSNTTADTTLALNEIDVFVEHSNRWRYNKVHAQFDTPWFKRVVRDPDALINAPWTTLLKHDVSTTVGLTSFDGQQIVIKRYNPRHPLYAAKRLLRESRASHCLRASIAFSLANIRVAQSVGLIEKRAGPFKRTSYYLMLYTHGVLLSDWFKEVETLTERDKPIILSVKDAFIKMASNQLFHGDMKATNLIWQNDRLVMVDLDAARYCPDPKRLTQRLDSDKARFLKNFADKPALQSEVKKELDW